MKLYFVFRIVCQKIVGGSLFIICFIIGWRFIITRFIIIIMQNGEAMTTIIIVIRDVGFQFPFSHY